MDRGEWELSFPPIGILKFIVVDEIWTISILIGGTLVDIVDCMRMRRRRVKEGEAGGIVLMMIYGPLILNYYSHGHGGLGLFGFRFCGREGREERGRGRGEWREDYRWVSESLAVEFSLRRNSIQFCFNDFCVRIQMNSTCLRPSRPPPPRPPPTSTLNLLSLFS